MKEVFVDRRARTEFGRRSFLVVWSSVAILFVLGVPVLGTVILHNLPNLGELSTESKTKLLVVSVALLACAHGAISLVYILLREFPQLIVRVQRTGATIHICTMTGRWVCVASDNVAILPGQGDKSFCWYKPYSLSKSNKRSASLLRTQSGEEYLIPHEADTDRIAAKLKEPNR